MANNITYLLAFLFTFINDLPVLVCLSPRQSHAWRLVDEIACIAVLEIIDHIRCRAGAGMSIHKSNICLDEMAQMYVSESGVDILDLFSNRGGIAGK